MSLATLSESLSNFTTAMLDRIERIQGGTHVSLDITNLTGQQTLSLFNTQQEKDQHHLTQTLWRVYVYDPNFGGGMWVQADAVVASGINDVGDITVVNTDPDPVDVRVVAYVPTKGSA